MLVDRSSTYVIIFVFSLAETKCKYAAHAYVNVHARENPEVASHAYCRHQVHCVFHSLKSIPPQRIEQALPLN